VVLVKAIQNFLMIDDKGDPNTAKEYEVESLLNVAYTLKCTIKKSAKNTDCGVMPLESLFESVVGFRQCSLRPTLVKS
jgi:hypothetical protein